MFISFINLDLGFDLCFYDGMTQITKTGLQFLFPVYLWLIIMIIIVTGKYFRCRHSSLYQAAPVLATLIMLSYSKLLRTTISVFSYVIIHYTSNRSSYNDVGHFTAWQPDPSIRYLHGWHCVLAVISLGVVLVYIVPFALGSTFPKIILRSKRLSYFFPLLDCFYAPYKDKHRSWFGVRLVVLVYLSGMESVLFSNQEASLLSGVVVVLAFAIVQAYIHPFKNTLINVLDLTFTGIFILLSVITLYLYPSNDEVNIAVKVLGFLAFSLFLVAVVFHLHDAVKHTKWYERIISFLLPKFRVKEKWEIFFLNSIRHKENRTFQDEEKHDPDYVRFRESFLEQM